MKRNQKFYRDTVAVFISVFLVCAAVSANPGVAVLKSIKNIPELDQTNSYWKTDDFILVPPGSHPDETMLFSAEKGMDLYLIRDNIPTSLQEHNDVSIKNIDSNWSLVQMSADLSKSILLPENTIFLGYPNTSVSRLNPFQFPETISRNAQIQTIVDTIESTQVMSDLTALADFQTRNSYAQGCWDSADWIKDEFTAMGYEVTLQEHNRQMGPNVIAEKQGVTNPEEIVIVCGHFDSISLQPQTLAPGADDNGTGTAATMNAARVMADVHFDRTIRFICFSGEEQGLRGSQAYAQDVSAANEQIVGVINLDMIGYVDQAPEDLEVIGNNDSEELVDLFIDCANTYTTLPTNRVINSSFTASDHASFWVQGYNALLGIEDNPINYPYYHTIDDTVDKVTPAFVTECTKAATATAAHLASPLEQQVYVYSVHWDDSQGDNDGFLDPGETVSVWVDIINNSDVPSGEILMTMLCLSGSQYVQLLDNGSMLESIQPGEQASNEEDPFILKIDSVVPEFTELTSIAALQCDAPHSSGRIFHKIITSYDYHDEIVVYSMDETPGWTADSAVWQWGEPQGQGGTEHGNPDPSSGATGSNVLGTNLAGDYPSNISTTITSPEIDLTEARYTELHFQRWLNIENSEYDQAQIRLINSEGEHLIWENPGEVTDHQWIPQSIDISDLADGQNPVQLMFSLHSDGGWEYSGWNLDDIRIAGLAPGDPIPTPTPSPTPADIGIDLKMADVILELNDPFQLTLDWWNMTPENHLETPVFIVLDIQGSYWFWPDWSVELSHETWDMASNTSESNIDILAFTWPEITGSMTDLRFLAAITTPDYQEIIGTMDIIQWEYR